MSVAAHTDAWFPPSIFVCKDLFCGDILGHNATPAHLRLVGGRIRILDRRLDFQLCLPAPHKLQHLVTSCFFRSLYSEL